MVFPELFTLTSRPSRKNLEFSRSCRSFVSPMSVPSSPVMTRRLAKI